MCWFAKEKSRKNKQYINQPEINKEDESTISLEDIINSVVENVKEDAL